MPDGRAEIEEVIPKLEPEERGELEYKLMLWHARTGTEIVELVTRNGTTFPIFSDVIEVPAPPGDTGPRCLRVRFPEDGAGDDEDDV